MSKSYSLTYLAIQLLDWCGLMDINFTLWVVIIVIIISVVAKIVPDSVVFSSFELSTFETHSFFEHFLVTFLALEDIPEESTLPASTLELLLFLQGSF